MNRLSQKKGEIDISREHIFEALEETRKKIEGLKGFHIPVVLNTIEEYEKAEVDGHFIEQQKLQLQKLYDMIEDLEHRAQRLIQRL